MTTAPLVVLLAPDKFKGSLSAAGVAAALASGIAQVVPDAEIRQVPVADGGDGTVDAFVAAGWERIEIAAPGPTGEPDRAAYAVHGTTAVIELAAVAGLTKLPGGQLDPLGAHTYGLGVVIARALDRGVTDIVLGLGGSASTDGGAGLLVGLGARVLDRNGDELPLGGAALVRAAHLDLTGLHPGIATANFTLACDVDNPLLGKTGAVAVYAPQKGATSEDLPILEAALSNWARIAGPEYASAPGAGAAGGTGFGALAVLGAQVRSGIEVVLELLDFPTLLDGADLVITGEGSFDKQSLHGKAPIGVRDAARKAGIPVLVVAGRILLPAEDIQAAGFETSYALSDLEPNPTRSIANAPTLLTRIGTQIATHHLPS